MMSRIAARVTFCGMIEAHAMQHAAAAVVAGGHKAIKPERRHHLDLVLRHGAERIAGMILAAGWFFGIAVAAQIGGDHGEFARQRRRNLEPRQMIKWIAVHQQNRRSVAADHRDDARAAGLDFRTLEAVEHKGASIVVLRLAKARCKETISALPKNKTPASLWRSRGHLIRIVCSINCRPGRGARARQPAYRRAA